MTNFNNHHKRVVVAMSGGVDSSVAALLLKLKGYEVIGISLKVWDYRNTDSLSGRTCCSREDIQDAREVCRVLKIPFYAFNYQDVFEKYVIKPFIKEYTQGRTPNPCILCNRFVKFGALYREAKKLGAGFLATGHHARVQMDDDGIFRLYKGLDENKDQSYVLYDLTQEELKDILLPVGEYSKDEIRNLAIQYEIPTATKKESQDICFIPKKDHAAFINEYHQRLALKGNFVDEGGRVMGEHEGIHHYTVGQRRGLKSSFGKRMYVTRIDPLKNEVILGNKEELLSSGLLASSVNWIYGQDGSYLECGVKIRYQKNEIPSVIEDTHALTPLKVNFKEKYPAVTPGQSVVFYKGKEVLGGGIIEKAL